jgi:hypothetical protein
MYIKQSFKNKFKLCDLTTLNILINRLEYDKLTPIERVITPALYK